MNPAPPCAECAYLQDERAGMWMDNGAPENIAKAEGDKERCSDHRETQTELFTDLKALQARTAALIGH